MPKQKNKLSPEELEMERAALAGADESASEERKDELRAAALATLDERKRPVNIRIDPTDLAVLKERAADSGLGYQTLIASVLHRFVVGDLVDRQVVDELKTFFLSAREPQMVTQTGAPKRPAAKGGKRKTEKRGHRQG